jgi:glycosyltransferase involved in cell wall biosynthesis
MKILVDAVSARQGAGLIFLSEQLPALERIADIRLTIIATEASCAAMRGGCPNSSVISWPMRPLAMRILREQTAIPRRAHDYDLVYSPGNFAIARPQAPQVLVLQSLWYFGQEARVARRHCPARMRMRLAAESIAARASVRKATRVICVSETLRTRVAEDVGGSEKITAIPYAVPELPFGTSQAPVQGPYALTVGTDLPHKDWAGLIRAFESHSDLPPLILVGWCSPARRRELAMRSKPGSVRFLGPVTDRGELADLYRNASCVIAHSHLESYGLTAIEALSVGTPIAASDIPAHREFCGPAAHYYDPNDGDALAAAVTQAIRTGPPSGSAPALALTWAENAAMTAAALRSAVDDQ